ncbi:MAG: hypothetical protein EOO65_03155 [Methanosarcinales archaeon]|nr:MAG: hypothetical protein EOO65_03155 [Methanosarcinales archaeon]
MSENVRRIQELQDAVAVRSEMDDVSAAAAEARFTMRKFSNVAPRVDLTGGVRSDAGRRAGNLVRQHDFARLHSTLSHACAFRTSFCRLRQGRTSRHPLPRLQPWHAHTVRVLCVAPRPALLALVLALILVGGRGCLPKLRCIVFDMIPTTS